MSSGVTSPIFRCIGAGCVFAVSQAESRDFTDSRIGVCGGARLLGFFFPVFSVFVLRCETLDLPDASNSQADSFCPSFMVRDLLFETIEILTGPLGPRRMH